MELFNIKSRSDIIKCGVPQGSILGPLLLLMYVNDISNSTSLKLLSFADDTTISCSSPDINKAIRDGRPRPPRHQVGWDIPLHFDTNPESLRPFVPEIWPNNVFSLSATYDLDL